MTSHKRSLLEALRKLLTSRSKPAEEAGMQRTGTVLRPSAALPASPAPENGSATDSKPPAEPSETPATARKPEAGSSEPTTREDTQEGWTAKTCPVHETGDRIEGRYEVQERFEGAMGYVYIARDTTQDLTFAIKQPKKEMLANRDFFARVLREADVWTGLGMHPHIAYCYFVKSLEGVPHIFVEYVDGGNLRDWIAEGRCPDERARLELAIQLCQGMEHAHGRGMIHRDIKPENILVTAQGTVKVTDFGLVGEAAGRTVAAPAGGKATGTRYGDLMGTPAYMAPEQIADPRRRSAEVPEGVWTDSDVYSFGVCLWELFCGGRPDQLEATGAAAIQRARPDLPAGLAELLLSSVAQNRAHRPQDFSALRERLNGIYRGLFREDAPSYRIEVPESAADELNNQGYSYFELGKPKDARTCFERAREIEPTHPQATYNLSLLQWRAGEIDDLEVLRRLENCKQNPAVDKQTLAELTAYVHAERFAPDLAREVLKEYPGRYEALFGEVKIGEMRCVRSLEGHTEGINRMARTPDGRRGLSGSSDQTLRPDLAAQAFEASANRTEKPVANHSLSGIRCLKTVQGQGNIYPASYRFDGRWLLSGSSGNELRLWNVEDEKSVALLEGHTKPANSVRFAPHGWQALSGGQDHTVRLWDVERRKCLATLTGHTSWVLSVDYSPDGRRAISGGIDNSVRLWDLDTQQSSAILAGHAGPVNTVCFGPDGRSALSGGHDNRIRIWDIHRQELAKILEEERTGHVKSVCYSPDGRLILAGYQDKILRVWDIEKGQCVARLSGHTRPINHVCFSPDGRRALSASGDKTVRIWDLGAKRCISTLEGHNESVFFAGFARDGFRVLSGGRDNSIRVWDLEMATIHGHPVLPLELCRPRDYGELVAEKKVDEEIAREVGALMLAGENNEAFLRLMSRWEDRGYVAVGALAERYQALSLRGQNTRLLGAYECWRREADSLVSAVSISPDGRRALSGGQDGILRVWDIDKGQHLATLKGHTGAVYSVCFVPNSRVAFSGASDNALRVWDLETEQCVATLEGHTGPIKSLSCSQDGRWVLSAGADNLIKLWDSTNRQCLSTLAGHSANISDPRHPVEGVNSVSFSPDGARAVSGGQDSTLRVWDLNGATCLGMLAGHRGSVHSVCFGPDSRRALSGGQDGTVRLWDLASRDCLRTFVGHTRPVTSVRFSPDGRHAISAGEDNTVLLWDLESGLCLTALEGHEWDVADVGFSPDGHWVLSGSWDKTLRLWRLIWDLGFTPAQAPRAEEFGE